MAVGQKAGATAIIIPNLYCLDHHLVGNHTQEDN